MTAEQKTINNPKQATKKFLLNLKKNFRSKNNSKITIISNHTNKYCCPARVKRSLQKFEDENISLNLHLEIDIDASVEYPKYQFRAVDGLPIIPNAKIVINVIK